MTRANLLWIAVALAVLILLVASCSPPLVRIETPCAPAPTLEERP